MADLNTIDSISSPAIFAGAEHLSGPQYADYLTLVANANQLPIACDCKVQKFTPHQDQGFYVATEQGSVFTEFLIWGCGEFQFPNLNPFPGGELCLHYGHIEDWQTMDAPSYTVIGGL